VAHCHGCRPGNVSISAVRRQDDKEMNMNEKTDTKSRTPIHGKGWKKPTTIATDKYNLITRAIMNSLTKTPIPFGELVKRIEARLESFDGSISWYTMSCLRELETQEKITKSRKPVLYSKK
jgi:L-fucose isomerase-like protein